MARVGLAVEVSQRVEVEDLGEVCRPIRRLLGVVGVRLVRWTGGRQDRHQADDPEDREQDKEDRRLREHLPVIHFW